MKSSRATEVAAALILDAAFGELPEAMHPTVGMGRVISAFERLALGQKSPHARYLSGLAFALTLPALVFVVVRALISSLPRRLRWPAKVALLSTSLSMRGLGQTAGAVERGLRAGDLEQARASVSKMVGRDTAGLPVSEVARAAVESVAENTSDGVVAPMLYGLLLGAPGALAYRAVNTMDSMVGYRTHPYAELGWAPARLDDLVNLAPSRVTALAVAAVSGHPLRTLEAALRYGPLTSSPNAGWAEAAFAGALGSRLGGPNVYGDVIREGPVLGDGQPPGPGEIRHSVRLMRRCCAALAAAAVLALGPRRG